MANVTNKDLYEAIENLEKKITLRIDKIDDEVTANTNFKNQLVGKMTVMMFIIGAAMNYVWDQIFNK